MKLLSSLILSERIDSSGSSTYRRDGAGATSSVLFDGTATYVPGVSRHTGSGTLVYDPDFIGSNRVESDASGNAVATRVYDAYGNQTAYTGSPSSPFGFAGAFGYQEDGDSGLKLLGHRLYDPTAGRFITRDPAQSGSNWYAYAGDSPLSRIDPTGHFIVVLIIVALGIVALAKIAADLYVNGVKVREHAKVAALAKEGVKEAENRGDDAQADRFTRIQKQEGLNAGISAWLMGEKLAYENPFVKASGSATVSGGGHADAIDTGEDHTAEIFEQALGHGQDRLSEERKKEKKGQRQSRGTDRWRAPLSGLYRPTS